MEADIKLKHEPTHLTDYRMVKLSDGTLLVGSITVEGKGWVFYTSYLRCESVAPLKIKFPVKQICSQPYIKPSSICRIKNRRAFRIKTSIGKSSIEF